MRNDVIDRQPLRTSEIQETLQPWQLAELTEYDLWDMSLKDLRQVVSSGLPVRLIETVPQPVWNSRSLLRRVAKQVRDSFRRQGY